MECPECSTEVWKHGMAEHCESKHGGVPLPTDLAVSGAEKARMQAKRKV
jgi:hypothetical protein